MSRATKRSRSAKASSTGVDFDEPLPYKYVPQLSPFPFRHSSIEFVRLLSDASTSCHSHVFDVIIESKHYALKIFKFYDVAEHAFPLRGQVVPQDMILAHFDPFYAECRAYGRIGDRKRNGKVAVRCYGFTAVSALQEVVLSETFGVSEWDRPLEQYSLPVAERQSFRAIVKDLIEDQTPFTKIMIDGMLRDLKSLRRMGLFVRDVRESNYKGGKLVDFSVSWTQPHIMLSDRLFDDEEIMQEIDWELKLFDKMIEDSRISTWVRATPNKEYLSKLRPRQYKK